MKLKIRVSFFLLKEEEKEKTQKTTQKIESPQLTETYANNEINENRQSVINIKRGHAEYIRDKKMKNLELQKNQAIIINITIIIKGINLKIIISVSNFNK